MSSVLMVKIIRIVVFGSLAFFLLRWLRKSLKCNPCDLGDPNVDPPECDVGVTCGECGKDWVRRDGKWVED